MFKLNQQNRNALMSIAILLVIIFALSANKNISNYQPMPIISSLSNEESLFDLPNDIACAPGFTDGWQHLHQGSHSRWTLWLRGSCCQSSWRLRD